MHSEMTTLFRLYTVVYVLFLISHPHSSQIKIIFSMMYLLIVCLVFELPAACVTPPDAHFKHNHFHNPILTILFSSNTFRGRNDRSARRLLGYPPSSHTHHPAHVGKSYRLHHIQVGAGLRTGYKFFQPSFTSLPSLFYLFAFSSPDTPIP